MVDGPGHGSSAQPPRGWTLDDHAVALSRVLDHLGLERAVLAGHSWGGMVSLRLALAQPQRVAGLGLVNTPLLRPRGTVRLGFRTQQVVLRLTGATPFYARQAAASVYDSRSLAERPDRVDEFIARITTQRGVDLTDAIRAIVLDPVDQMERLVDLTVPVAVVAGETDYVFPPAVRDAVTRTLPSAVVTVVKGGHTGPHEDPDAVTLALRGLLERADGGSGPLGLARHQAV